MTSTRKVLTLVAAASVIALASATSVSENSVAQRIEVSAGVQASVVNVDTWQSDVVATTTAGQVGPLPGEPRGTERGGNKPDSRTPREKMSGPLAAILAAGGAGEIEVIIRYDQHPELFDDARVARLGGEVTRSYEVLNMRAIRIAAAELENLAGDANIDRLSLDDRVFAMSVASRVAANVPKGSAANAPFRGAGVGVAIIDTGSAPHNDLESQFSQYSFLNGNYPRPTIKRGDLNYNKLNDSGRGDSYGHGTHVAGILAGSGDDSDELYKGSAASAHFLSLEVLESNGSGSLSDVMASIDWLLAYGQYFDIRIVNLSLGKAVTESSKTDPLVIAVESLWDAGYVVVVAAGNYGHYGNLTITSPANSRKVITVGALTDSGTGADFTDDYVSTFSSLGPTLGDYVVKPDLVAPGNRLVGTIPANSVLATDLSERLVACSVDDCGSVYLELSGTSMAAPMVSAAAARMLEKDPTLTPATIKARLMRSARKFDVNFVASGAGLLDVDAAMNESGVIAGEALSPLMYDDSANGGVVIEDTAVLWGDSTWGSGYIWADGFAWTNGFTWTDADGVSSKGYSWTDGGGVNASGFGWTDGSGVRSNGFGWTDGVSAKGFGWTDYVGMQMLLIDDGDGLTLNDDGP